MIVPNLVPTAILHKDYAGLEAIDGFLATQLCQSLGSQNAIMQHLIMALSRARCEMGIVAYPWLI